ncbi:hypothetical protein TPEGhana051_0967 [Treponema pallidum subsp. pertenue]|uniref:hypothetical protein n=1 Tax=Treponema pallidum TaxID=160 RepID=UPI000BA7249C|nr:hypothetical protein [Treponema pallidum]ASV58632.1 hypothetical protein TPEGhana051_0967 [Treponema pallidum subsp. pertenue]ASV59695.1 hypothetical protein TPECDC2575_0967 [Treponema pallidum subsp. pertenue]AZN66862.1 hypothetical protein TPECDC1_0967 [Treponema pallidum subsp. pertenue]
MSGPRGGSYGKRRAAVRVFAGSVLWHHAVLGGMGGAALTASELTPGAPPAVSARAAAQETGTDLYQRVVRYRLQRSTAAAQAVRRQTITQSQYDKQRLDSLVRLSIAAGDIAWNADGVKFRITPKASVAFPSFYNLTTHFGMTVTQTNGAAGGGGGGGGAGNGWQKTLDAGAGIDLYSSVRRSHVFAVNTKYEALRDAQEALACEPHVSEKQVLEDMRRMLDSYVQLLHAQESFAQKQNAERSVQVAGYTDRSIVYRAAALERERAQDALKVAQDAFDGEYRDFIISAGQEFLEKRADQERFLLALAESVPEMPLVSTEHCEADTSRPLRNAREAADNEREERAVQNFPVALRLDTRFTLDEGTGELSVAFPSVKITSALAIGYTGTLKSIGGSLDWHPFEIRYAHLRGKNQRLHDALGAREYAQKKEQQEKVIADLPQRAEDILWERETARAERDTYAESARAHRKGLDRGVIGARGYAAVHLDYVRAVINLAKANVDALIFNIDARVDFLSSGTQT